MAKRGCEKPAGFELSSVEDVYSVSSHVNDDFADYIDCSKHNGFWLFDSPEIIREVARENPCHLKSRSCSITKRTGWSSMRNR